MKQFDITVKIRVTVEADYSMTEAEWADHIAHAYAKMALTYTSIGADEVIRVDVKEA
jgi:peptidyl-tRNA hydrolase